MENTKRTIILLLCLIFAFSPLVTLGSFSYADNTPPAGGGTASSWVPVEDTEALVASFKAYCKSRNLDVSHVPNTVKAIVTWDYKQLQLYAGLANIDLDGLQAHIWYAYENDDKVKFFIDKTGVVGFSKIYAKIVEEAGLTENTQKQLYSGRWFQDDYGNGAYCFVLNTSERQNITENEYNSYPHGSVYNNLTGNKAYAILSSQTVTPYDCKKNGISYLYYLNCAKDYNINGDICSWVKFQTDSTWRKESSATNCIYWIDDYYEVKDGYVAIIYDQNTTNYYVGYYRKRLNKSNNTYNYTIHGIVLIGQNVGINANINASQGEETTPPENQNLIINTNDTTINNYITNDNDTITYNYTNDDPTEPPVYTDPYDNNPTGGVLNPDGSINFQMPDLNIDWHLNLNTNNLPFPFSIPYDMINFFNAFSAEPVAPHIQEDVTIANITIPIDIDLEWLDDVAGYFRTFVLLIYVFGLIIATRALFHIY